VRSGYFALNTLKQFEMLNIVLPFSPLGLSGVWQDGVGREEILGRVEATWLNLTQLDSRFGCEFGFCAWAWCSSTRLAQPSHCSKAWAVRSVHCLNRHCPGWPMYEAGLQGCGASPKSPIIFLCPCGVVRAFCS